MKANLLCDKDIVALDVPDSVTLLEMKAATPVFDPAATVEKALDNPIGTPRLSDLARGKRDACIVISDITRPVPNQLILPPMLRVLEESGIPREKITILISTGMHRPNEGAELESIVGREIMENYTIRNHFCRRSDEYRLVDKIEGAPIEINKYYLDAELKILTGLIEPHFYAGFSGGRKSILPGISSYDTMKFMHSYSVINRLGGATCNLENNIFHDYALQVARLAGVDFILNVAINKQREITGVFAGDLNDAHLKGCKMIADHSVIRLPEKVDLVITSAGGFPLDSSFYQVSKALTCSKEILNPGGTILVTCGCREGMGNEEFCGIMEHVCKPDDFFNHYCEPDNFVIDQWCAQNIFQALDHAGKVYVYSPGLSAPSLKGIGAEKVEDPQAVVDQLIKTHDKVVVIPDGPYVVGKV